MVAIFFSTPLFIRRMPPTLTFKDNTYTFTLLRDDKEVVHKFNRTYHVIVCGELETSVLIPARAKILGPAYDGKLYWIDATRFKGEETFIWLSKEEFEILYPMYKHIEDQIYYNEFNDSICSFCNSHVDICGENHAKEIREIVRESIGYWD